jgi:LuxR family transcriptional regulator, quorum-sensing system regulator BjaR1
MLLTNSTFEFIDEIDRQDDTPSLVAAFQGLIGKFGMTSFMMGNPSQPQILREDRLWATTWPEAWLRHWSAQNYISIDPVVNKLLTRNESVRWESEDASDEATARILEEASQFRMKAGYALPIYSREGFVVAISMDTEHYEIGKVEETCLHMASIFFHAKLERLRAKNAVPPRGPRLTRRERECLSWVAAGKTDWEISQILNIAEQTVHEYVQNALMKLNATTRAQAVAVAIFSKQIAV